MRLYPLIRPLLFALDPERAHGLVFSATAVAFRLPGVPASVRAVSRWAHPVLAQELWGLRFPNPVGLAAGFDKDGRLIEPLGALGFGFLELGTVTPRPQPGNPRPRLFRLPADRALINRMGFNNAGAAALAGRLAAVGVRPVPIGVNVGKNRDTPLEAAGEDYVAAAREVLPAADFLTVNVSSPNTPGLRDLQARDSLRGLLGAVVAARDEAAAQAGRRVPLLVKLAPDLDEGELRELVDVAIAGGADGLVATNTTLARDGLHDPRQSEAGGLSGRPLHPRALAAVRTAARAAGGRVPIVGVGGIFSGADAYAMIRAGASLVQVYTALIYEGPGVVKRIKRELAALLARDGFTQVSRAVGADLGDENAASPDVAAR